MKLRNTAPVAGTFSLVLFLLTVVIFGEARTEAATLKVPGSYATIQAAIDAASAGDTIKISNGTYNENIVIDKKLRIRGKSKTRIVSADDSLGSAVVKIEADNVELKRLDIRGGFYGVIADSVNKPRLLSLRTHGAIAEGIYLLRTDDALLSKCRSYDNGLNGYFLQDSSPGKGASIKKCRAYRNSNSGIHLLTLDGVKVESCRCYENGSIGISISLVSGAKILKNKCWKNDAGISVGSNSTDCLVEGNTLSDNQFTGLYVTDSLGVARKNTSKNNKIGFFTDFSEDFTTEWVFENNTAEKNTEFGFEIQGNDSTFSQNKAIDNQGVGFYIESESCCNQVEDNLASGNGGHGFLVDMFASFIPDHSPITGNRSLGNGGDGFHAHDFSGNAVFKDNFADENSGFGFVDNGTDTVFEGNECGGNNEAGPSDPVGLCD